MGYVCPPTLNGRALPTNEHLIYDRALPALPESVRRVRNDLEALLDEGERRSDIALVVSEAATNVVLHAYPPLEPGLLLVDAMVAGPDLRLRVCDCGRGMVGPSERAGLGVGLLLMARFADEFEIGGHRSLAGTRVEATFHVDLGARGGARAAATEEFDGYVAALRAWHADDALELRAHARHALHDAERLRAQR